MATIPDIKHLYDHDFVAWCEATVAQLKAGQLDQIDLENLIEEIDSLGKRDRRELKSRLTVLLAHLLKRLYVNLPENFNGWELTIREQRRQLQDILSDSPSLKSYLWEVFDQAYANVGSDLKLEYPQVEFPNSWPFAFEDLDALLSQAYWVDN